MGSKSSHGPDATLVGADDFKIIHGIGPGVESRLHSRGVATFAQLAALAPNEIAALLSDVAGLSADRITKQDWIGQARELAPDSPGASVAPAEAEGRQRYATLTNELLLDEDDMVRRTRIVHIQDDHEDTWAHWDEARLIDFIRRRFDPHGRRAEAQPAAVDTPATLAPAIDEQPSPATLGADDALAPVPPMLAGTPRLRDLALLPVGEERPHTLLNHAQRFVARLNLDMTDMAVPRGAEIAYTATLYARRLGGRRALLGEARGTLAADDANIVEVRDLALDPGTYRLEALVALAQPNEADSSLGLSALLEGGLIQVY
jgi:hypothetical protein